MKVSKEQAIDNRAAIVRAAAAQIRERGLDQMNVNEVARDAGLTHGALYSHFKSKDALQAAATSSAFEQTLREFSGLTPDEFLGRYLSAGHRDHPGMGCPNASLVSEVWRQPEGTREAFHDGIKSFIGLTRETLSGTGNEVDQDRAITIFAALVGGLALARAMRDADPDASDSILGAVARQLGSLAGTHLAEGAASA